MLHEQFLQFNIHIYLSSFVAISKWQTTWRSPASPFAHRSVALGSVLAKLKAPPIGD